MATDRLYLLCFDQAEFRTEEDFNPAAFLVEKRKYVSIDTLAKDLQTFREHLQEEVVHLVNTDVYDTFLSVTNKLYQRETELVRLQAPLPNMMSRVQAAKGKLSNSKEKVEEKLKLIMDLEKKKAFAVQKLKVSVTEHKLRKTLQTFEKTQPDSQQQSQRLSLLLTLVTESHQLEISERLWSPATPEQTADQDIICSRLSELRHHICNLLRQEYVLYLTKYKEGVSTEDVSDVLNRTQSGLEMCFKAYIQLEDEATAVSIFREIVCDPSAEETIPWTAASGGRDIGAVSKVLQRPTEVCANHWKPLIKLGHEVGIHSLVIALWQAFSDTVSKRLHFLFDSSNPHLFNQRYTAAHKFANAVENCCFSDDALQQLRQEMKLWESRWNMEIYFKMCEIAAVKQLSSLLNFDVEKLELSSASALQTADDNIPLQLNGFTYAPAAAVYSVVMWCASDKVVLYPLGHKIIKLCIAVVDSLRKWILKWIETNNLPMLSEEGENQGEDIRLSDVSVTENTLLDLHLDITLLSAQLRTTFKPLFKSHYESLATSIFESMEVCVDAVCSTTSSSQKVSSLLISLVATRCIEPLRATVTDLNAYLFAKEMKTNERKVEAVLEPLKRFKHDVTVNNRCPEVMLEGMLLCYDLLWSFRCRNSKKKKKKKKLSLVR